MGKAVRFIGIVAVLVLVVFMGPSSGPPAGRASSGTCPTKWLRAVRITGIALTGANEGWAVANHSQAGGTWPITSGCIYRLAGGEWRPAPSAPIIPGPYACYTAIGREGPTDVWAVGLGGGLYSCQSGSVLVHRHRRRWATVDIDRVLNAGVHEEVTRRSGLLDIDMVDEGHGWAVAWLTILRFEAGEWSIDFEADCCLYGSARSAWLA